MVYLWWWSTKRAFEEAFSIKKGQKKVSTTQEAGQVKLRVKRAAAQAGKLNKQELAVLQEGARAAVDTGVSRK